MATETELNALGVQIGQKFKPEEIVKLYSSLLVEPSKIGGEGRPTQRVVDIRNIPAVISALSAKGIRIGSLLDTNTLTQIFTLTTNEKGAPIYHDDTNNGSRVSVVRTTLKPILEGLLSVHNPNAIAAAIDTLPPQERQAAFGEAVRYDAYKIVAAMLQGKGPIEIKLLTHAQNYDKAFSMILAAEQNGSYRSMALLAHYSPNSTEYFESSPWAQNIRDHIKEGTRLLQAENIIPATAGAAVVAAPASNAPRIMLNALRGIPALEAALEEAVKDPKIADLLLKNDKIKFNEDGVAEVKKDGAIDGNELQILGAILGENISQANASDAGRAMAYARQVQSKIQK